MTMIVKYGKGFEEPMRAKVERLGAAMVGIDPVDCPITHHFAPGIYAREMVVPAGTILVGAVHKTKHLSILSKGRAVVATADGIKQMSAPCTLIADAGAKRSITAIDDCVWTTIHATTTTDIDALVSELTESTAAQLQGGAENPQQLAYAKRMELEG